MDHCKWQLSRMGTKPKKSYFIDMPPKNGEVDLVPRIQAGIELAREDGFDLCFVIEDDDYYPHTYFDTVDDNAEFIGEYGSVYYSLINREYQHWPHYTHSSLFTTGFRISALNEFQWPIQTERFLDLAIWSYVKSKRKKIQARESVGAIGIKHGIGLCGGKGHTQRFKYTDKNLEWLKSVVDEKSFNFYKTLL